MIPTLFLLPILVGLSVWPTFIIIGLFRSHDTQDLDTVDHHLSFLRHWQARIYSNILERIHEQEVK